MCERVGGSVPQPLFSLSDSSAFMPSLRRRSSSPWRSRIRHVVPSYFFPVLLLSSPRLSELPSDVIHKGRRRRVRDRRSGREESLRV
jgi:hypothetical protein